MRLIGFSTGALALGDVRRALAMLAGKPVNAIELSALRQQELQPLVQELDQLDLERFKYKAFHAPSWMEESFEPAAIELLDQVCSRGWPIIVHPDAMHTLADWRHFGPLLFVENMDKRKPIGQTAVGLSKIFEVLPDANLCFDIGHARQVDPTMSEGAMILQWFQDKLLEIHVSDVNSRSKHDRLTLEATMAFRRVAHCIPRDTPIILESRVDEAGIEEEIRSALQALDPDSFFGFVMITPVVSAGHKTTERDISGVRFSIGVPGTEVALGQFFVTWTDLRAALLRSKILPDDHFSAAEAHVCRGDQWKSPLLPIKDDQLTALASTKSLLRS